MPYGYGVYLSNITRAQLEKSFTPEELNEILPASRDMQRRTQRVYDSRTNLWRLESLIKHHFVHNTTPQQLDRIRWHLYPDVRINPSVTRVDTDNFTFHTPDVVCMMDRNREQLARSMGAGHRVIHGVAGSGKTLILHHRCIELANNIENTKPILVICYNITLAKNSKRSSNSIASDFPSKLSISTPGVISN